MAAAATSFTITETWRGSMVIAHGIQKWIDKKLRESEEKFREKMIAKGRAEGRAEVEAKVHEWAEWNARRDNALARGENFTEPPPNGKV
jgi:hypothetical protein